MRLFVPNLDRPGRVARSTIGGSLAAIGAVVFAQEPLLGIALLAAGVFMLFEGLRGWCALRACRIRTPI
jgi:sulfite exporter TauE/SafE